MAGQWWICWEGGRVGKGMKGKGGECPAWWGSGRLWRWWRCHVWFCARLDTQTDTSARNQLGLVS
jgi:hypothetical protein